jgi:hypothetical protein
MASIHNTRARHRAMAGTVTVGLFTALIVISAVPAWAQVPPAPSVPSMGEAWMMGAEAKAEAEPKADGEAQVGPRFHGYLLDDGEFTIIDAPGTILGTAAAGINTRSQIVGFYLEANEGQ